MTACMYIASVLQWGGRKPATGNIPHPQNDFQRNCRSLIPVLLESIETTLGQFVWT